MSLIGHLSRAPAPSALLSGTLSHRGASAEPRDPLLGRLGASCPPPRDEGLYVHLWGPGRVRQVGSASPTPSLSPVAPSAPGVPPDCPDATPRPYLSPAPVSPHPKEAGWDLALLPVK